MLSEFHFLYPYWFLLLPVLALFLWWLSRIKANGAIWNEFIDGPLKSFVLTQDVGTSNRFFLGSLLIAGLLAITALAGPSWDKHTVPAFQAQQGLVVAMDLSTSMIVTDVKPSRLVRARFKLIDLLKMRKEGQTGLVVFAGAAFPVSPLTDDMDNIIEQVKYLGPGTMPVQGSRLDLAIDESAKLLKQSGFNKGNILLITDGLINSSKTNESAEDARESGFRVSILAVGTQQGATIPLAGGRVLQDNRGMAVVTSLNEPQLQQVAKSGGGIYRVASLTDEDVQALSDEFSIKASDKLSNDVVEDEDRDVEYWNNAGIWLAILMLPFVLLLFRKGVLFSLLVLIFTLPFPDHAQAYEWQDLWQNPDQRGMKALKSDKPDQALELFDRKDWKATAAYRHGEYEMAEQLFAEQDSADANYNRGNALAKQGKLDAAIKAYQQALNKDSTLEDAQFNKALVEKIKKQQEQQNNQQSQQQNQQDKDQQKSDQQQNKNQQGDQSKQEQSDQQKKNEQSQQQDPQQNQQQQEDPQQANEQQQEQNQQGEEGENKQDQQQVQRGRQGKKNKDEKGGKEAQQKSPEEIQKDREKNQRADQWLRKIPDDPAGLWRRKFMYQYRQSGQSQGEAQPW